MFKFDGHTRRMTVEEIKPGHVVRSVNQEVDTKSACSSEVTQAVHAWGDTLIVGIIDGEQVLLARPYMYATDEGTTCPNWVMGVENFKVTRNSLLRHYEIVLMSTGKPACFKQ